MATCPHADRLIPLLHDNELQNPLRREMVTHMTTCVTCARTFSLLEREQELFTQAIEERVDSIDFSSFWQAVELQLSESSLSWRTRLRLWYESWQSAWAFPVPAWAVATLLLCLVPTHLALHNGNTIPLPPVAGNEPFDSPPIQQVGLNDDQAQIESIESYGDGAVGIQIHRDYESKSTFISFGDGTSEYPQ